MSEDSNIESSDSRYEQYMRGSYGEDWRYSSEAFMKIINDKAAAARQNPKEIRAALPEESAARKEYPLFRGVFAYFPKALGVIAKHSYEGGKQHGHGENIHWDRSKSSDDKDALLRHAIEGDWQGAAWRALAVLEKELEK